MQSTSPTVMNQRDSGHPRREERLLPLCILCAILLSGLSLLYPVLLYPAATLTLLYFLSSDLRRALLYCAVHLLLVSGLSILFSIFAAQPLPLDRLIRFGLGSTLNIGAGILLTVVAKSRLEAVAAENYIDPLVGIPNRKQLIQDLQHVRVPILFLINVDDFKEINDVFGPKAGDMILFELGGLIGSLVSNEEIRYYKLGADEYALLFENLSGEYNRRRLTQLAEAITRSISAEKFNIASSEIRLRATIGIGDSRLGGNNILAQADMALKTAKTGHKPFLFFTQTIDTRENYQQNINALKTLTDALENDRIVPYFMPIVSSATGKVESYECLARLIDHEGTVFPPYYFLEIARKARLYSQITRLMFRKAADYFDKLTYQFTINISMDDMDDPETVSTMLEILQERPSLENRVIFEILESESIDNYPQVSTFIQLVKAYGCKIAIDDFGSGYSNFEYIPRLNIDYLKINGELIKNITKNPQNRFIVENIHNFAAGLGIRTVAEYVEDQGILDELREIRVDYLQGYYFGAPAGTIHSTEVAQER